jgi:hypothetical protein
MNSAPFCCIKNQVDTDTAKHTESNKTYRVEDSIGVESEKKSNQKNKKVEDTRAGGTAWIFQGA